MCRWGIAQPHHDVPLVPLVLQVSNYREHEANRLAEVLVLEQPKYSNMREKKAMRLTPAHLGIEGCKNELLEVRRLL